MRAARGSLAILALLILAGCSVSLPQAVAEFRDFAKQMAAPDQP